MKLALIISSLSTGGAERVISLLANYWAGRGEDVSLITIDSAASDSYPLDTRVRRLPLGLVADSGGYIAAVANNRRRIIALRAAIKATGARVAVSFGEHANVQLLLATRFSGVRCVISERTDPAQHHIAAIWRVLRRMTYPMADALVVQTKALLPWARTIVRKERAHVIPNPVRDMRHVTAGQSLERAAKIVAAGRLVAAKGFDVLLEAFALLARQLPQCRLVILGEGPERERLMKLARTLQITEKVSLPGRVAEPGEVLTDASLFVLSSLYEGFPNALLEAMACGVPVISTACRGPVEIITHEVDGLLVPVSSAAELAAAMLRLMKDEPLRRKLADHARAVCSRYRLESIVQEWDGLLGADIKNSDPALRHPAASER
ncbi:MAG: GalNAc-alpha-(1-_4)-GalNAc-alpha-(1-_3)-diNAcBac-PP-undecaprenol [Betaproteobacteria bacterium]|jgi:GalNAc-alpha-(1->4)-GalNAc-alpha-(1->3)-diNAcBac-PP-undecaprenol alpha-1,4-N-acetyl-D-galactosaminyltransferase